MALHLGFLLVALAAPASAPPSGSPDDACAALHLPAVRACLLSCAERQAADLDARWDCQQACSRDGLRALAACRAEGRAGPGGT
jgi:hypothetical protein